MDLLVVSNLTKIFKSYAGWFSKGVIAQHTAINNISFSLKQGEIVGLMGANGAGKSTLMHMLIGILSPTSGAINYFGKDFAKHRSEILQDVTFSSSYFKPAQSQTVLQNLEFFARIYNVHSRSAKKIDDLLYAFGLFSHKHTKIGDLSAGESNKVSILKAFLPDSKIILLDEPTAFLDNKTAILVRNLIKEQRNKTGTTFFLTSHNQQDIIELCDRMLVLERGSISMHDYFEDQSSHRLQQIHKNNTYKLKELSC